MTIAPLRQQLASCTKIADRGSWAHNCSPTACLAMNSCDIGTAKINGVSVYTTWGRNLDKSQQEWFAEHTIYTPIYLGADDGSAELIIPDEQAEKIMM